MALHRCAVGRRPGTNVVPAADGSTAEQTAKGPDTTGVCASLPGRSRAGHRHKPSGIAAKEMIRRAHLKPALGHRKLDAIKSEDVQRLKRELEVKVPKTVNNILAVLSVL